MPNRFASFFTGPLFNRDAISREINAVNSGNVRVTSKKSVLERLFGLLLILVLFIKEFKKNLLNDNRRLDQLLRSTANPSHPFHKFGTGELTKYSSNLNFMDGINSCQKDPPRHWTK